MTSFDSITNATSLDFLDKLHDDQQNWNTTLYASANSRLLTLLSECLAAYHRLSGDRRMLKLFTVKLDALGIPYNAGTHLASKIIRYVFRLYNSRTAAYARVLRTALDLKKAPNELAAWVVNLGGIENVRRLSKSGKTPTKQAQESANQAVALLLKCDALATIAAASADLTPDNSTEFPFSLAVVRQNDAGDYEIVRCVRNATLLRSVLAGEAKSLNAENDNAAAAQQQSDKRAQSNAIAAEAQKSTDSVTAVAA